MSSSLILSFKIDFYAYVRGFFLPLALLFFLSLGQSSLGALEELPWFGNYYEIAFQTEGRLQYFPCVAQGSKNKKYKANDLFLNARLGSCIPDPDVELEAAACLAWTQKQVGDIDHLQLSLKKLWFDDIAGDPLSCTTSIGYIQAFHSSLADVSSFHHGLYNLFFGASIGKETADGSNWKHREWLHLGVGLAERGSPWLSFSANAERRLRESHIVSLSLEGLYGLGHRKLHLHDFNGYGALAHRSVDAVISYLYEIDYVGSIRVEYSYRFYSENFPAKASHLLFTFLYTFGL